MKENKTPKKRLFGMMSTADIITDAVIMLILLLVAFMW